MGRSIASLGTMTPDIMTNEINANLKDIEGLSTKERRALSKGGGMIAAMLENIGLGFMIRGIPPGVFAKMGLKKTAELIESNIVARTVAKGGTASLTEGITEGGQEATGIGAELIAGKEFKEGEIAERIIEAATIGASVGGSISGGGTVTAEVGSLAAEVPKAAGRKVAEGVSKIKDRLKPEQTEDVVPKFDKTIDRRKKLKLQDEPKFDTPSGKEEFTDAEGERWVKLDADENVELKEDTVVEPTESEAAAALDKQSGPKEKPFKIQPKKIPAEPSPKEVSTPSTEGAVSPAAKPDSTPEAKPKAKTRKEIEFELARKSAEEAAAKVERLRLEAELEAERESVILPEAKEETTDAEIEAEEIALEDQQALDEKEVEVEGEKEARETVEDFTGVKEEDEVQLEEQDESDRQEAEKNREAIEAQEAEDAKVEEESVEAEVARRMEEVIKREKEEVDIYDDEVRMPVDSLYTRDKERAESLKVDFPDGMNWNEYRDDLQEIKQEQLDNIDSDKDVDDFADELDDRADNNFTRAVKRKKTKEPSITAKEMTQKILAEKQEEEFDKEAEGIVDTEEILPEEDQATTDVINAEDEAFLEEEEVYAAKYKGGVMQFTPYPDGGTRKERKAWSKIAKEELKEAKEREESFKDRTVEEVKTEVEAAVGKRTLKKLTKNGAVTILQSDADLVKEEGVSPTYMGKNLAGAYVPKTGKVYIIADNSPRGTAGGTILHEVGEHAALEQMVGEKQYEDISKSFDKLLSDGDKIAELANSLVPKNTPKDRVKSEQLAYLIQSVEDKKAKGEEVSSKTRNLVSRIYNLIRKWFQNLPAYRKFASRSAFSKLESGEFLSPENITSLARAAVDFHAEGKTKPSAKKEPQFSVASETTTEPTTDTPPIGESKFSNVTARIKAAHGKKPKDKVGTLESIWNVTKEAATTIKDQMTRSHKLLDPKKFGLTTDYLRLMQETGSYAKHKAYTDVYSVIGKMNDKEQLVFSMNLILPDMIKDIESGLLDPKQGLPFGYETIEQVKEDFEVWEAHAKTITEDPSTDVNINESIEKRTAFMSELRQELVDNGLLREELLEDDRYFHHQVLEYLNMEDAGFTVSLEKPGSRITKQGWQKARTGSAKDYNTKYLDAEFEVLSQARQQLEAQKLLNKIRVENDKGAAARKLRTELNDERKIKGQQELSLEKTLKESEDFEGYVVWEPNPKGVWFQTYTVADKVAKQILEEGGAEVTAVRKAFVQGKKEKWVIPKELAETLNKPTKNESEAFPVAWSRKGIRAWKVWTLLNPFRILRYNLNNMSGDLDIALAYSPKILGGMKQAVKDLYQEKKNPDGPAAAELNEARRQGIIDSGFVITEVDDFSKMYEGLFEPKPSNTLEKLTHLGKKIPKSFREWTTYRENLIRLAAWRYFKKKIKDNPDMKIYAASKQTEIDAITDPEQKAAKLARELIGDYGNISHAGQAIRTHLMPFYSWMEINAPRYIRLMRNSKAEGKDIKAQLAKVAAKQVAFKGVGLMARMMAFSTLVSAYNAVFFSDEEEKLSEFERQQLHIHLGTWDGEIATLRFQGAFSDFVSWASLHDAPSDITDMMKGDKSVTDQLVEMVKAPALKIAGGISPLIKTPMEMWSGESSWPDFFNPRPIRDRFEHIANAFSLGTVYKLLAGKPNKGFGEWSKLLVSSTDPGESAYYKNWSQVRKWREKLGKDDVGGHKPSTKANALYYYKQAMKYQDLEAAWKYYVQYINLSGGVDKDGNIPKKTLTNIKRSIKRANPRSRIPAGTWDDFQKTFTPGQRKTWNEGIDWFEETYKPSQH
jgi:hypothetical protein